jgi:hypothetical protein
MNRWKSPYRFLFGGLAIFAGACSGGKSSKDCVAGQVCTDAADGAADEPIVVVASGGDGEGGTIDSALMGIADAGDAGRTSGCEAGATRCAADCVDTATDDSHCGGCGNACTGGAKCMGGSCTCPAGTHVCGGACSDNSSTSSCGTTLCTLCPAPANGSATCDGVACGVGCDAGFIACGGACVDKTLNGNCGGCGNTCGISCTGSTCINATAIAAGYDYACALVSSGTVKCWGGNDYGQLGYASPQQCTSTTTCSTSPNAIPGLTGVTAISAGVFHACAVLVNGTVECWGLNDAGQLGVTTTGTGQAQMSALPVVVPGITKAVTVAAGYKSTCAVIADGTLECWGKNDSGQLGDPSLTATQSSTPVKVSGIVTATAVVVGELHACALQSDHTVVCWGDNNAGELGSAPMNCDDAGNQCSRTPTPVTGLTGVTALGGGGGLATCALAGGNVQCWGYLQTGLGDSAGTQKSSAPVSVSEVGMQAVTGLAVGQTGACSIGSSGTGTVACWGAGALGNGTNNASSIPVAVSSLTNVVALAVGASNTCTLLSTGTVWCWGVNAEGELGNGTNAAPSLTPTPVVW